jgi:hypothetical protein
MKIYARFLVPLFFLTIVGSAWGQYTSSYGYTFNNPISASCNSIVWNRMNSRMTYRNMLKRRGYTDAQVGQMSTDQMLAILGGQTTAQDEAKKSLPNSVTAFKPAAQYLLLPTLAKSLVTDPEQQNTLIEVFDAGIKAYENEAAASGFSHDIAGAMTFFIGTSYFVYHDAQEPDENGLEYIGRALQQSLNTDEVAQISDADKQTFYELMVGLATYLGVAYQQAVADNDNNLAAQLKQVAADALKGFLKLDPDTVRITADGLEVAR